MSANEQVDSIGARVKRARFLAGMTQQRLATDALVSLSLVKAVEQGRVPASPAFVAAVARALKTDSAYLLDLPQRADDSEGHRVHAVIPDLRREIAAYRMPSDDGVHPRSFSEISESVAKASKLRHSVALDSLGVEIPGLLSEIRVAIAEATGNERERLFGLLAEAYAAAGQVAWKLGYADLSSLITDRLEWAAHQSQDPLAAAAADFCVAGELIITAQWSTALIFCERARGRIEDFVRTGDEAALAMYGMLHLKSGLAAARAGDTTTSDAHLTEARSAAKRVRLGSDHYRLAFDEDNVNIWAVGLAVERLDGTEAVKRAQGLRFSASTPRERIGHHWIDLARAYQLHGDRERALSVLHKARKTTPQQARYNPQVRETLLTLAAHDRRRSDSLSGFARWAGIKL
ncbi:helix-turn-helix domain-containing protein [Saccharothrix deserti]|uniref:helix-turn-helix domain-containing protein n=1 Tax=Saccharothrix deserti TaxID=2593674 RepID=UPI00131E655F|nr:helix-turn-helix transcriptional regulator [Saccharothrix deserti]